MPRTFALGDVDQAWPRCSVVVSGRADSGGQEHIYLETQSSLAVPADHGGVKIYSATQSPTVVQRTVARVLGLAMHQVEVDVPRLGGAFGGKEDQATAWAALAALAAFKLGRAVKLVLSRSEDVRFTGKRHPYSSDYKIGLAEDGKILAYEVTYFQNAGASADLSPAILERTLFHATGSYFVPNVRATAASCRTNLPPFTAFRGFGAPQAMFVMEAAIAHAAAVLGLPAAEIQRRNLLRLGDELPYGMRLETDSPVRCWDELDKRHDLAALRTRVAEFNSRHSLTKKGLAVMPVCFGISFTTTLLNQAAALVHVYTDGSVGISTAGGRDGPGSESQDPQGRCPHLGCRARPDPDGEHQHQPRGEHVPDRREQRRRPQRPRGPPGLRSDRGSPEARARRGPRLLRGRDRPRAGNGLLLRAGSRARLGAASSPGPTPAASRSRLMRATPLPGSTSTKPRRRAARSPIMPSGRP